MCSQQLVWAVACVIAYIIAICLNYLSMSPLIETQTVTSDKYDLSITPPGWTFSIWGIIYLWQTVWLFYITYHSIRYRQELKSKEMVTFNKTFYISWILSCLFNGAWILLFAYELLTISAIILISISVALYVNGYAGHKYIGLASEYLAVSDDDESYAANDSQYPSYLLNKTTINLYRVFLLNGIAFYGTWCSIAQCLNIGIFLTYVADIEQQTSCLIALAILTMVILAYWFLDFYYLRKWLVHIWSPYLVLLWALSAVQSNPSEGDLGLKGAVRTWVYVLLAMTAVGSVAKIISSCCYKRSNDESLNGEHINQYSGVEAQV